MTFQIDTNAYRRISRRQLLLMASTGQARHAATLCHYIALATFEEHCDQDYYEPLKSEAPRLAALRNEISRHLRSRSTLRRPMLLFRLAQQSLSSKCLVAMIETFSGLARKGHLPYALWYTAFLVANSVQTYFDIGLWQMKMKKSGDTREIHGLFKWNN